MNPEPPETLTHPVFGELRWEEQSGWWFAQVNDASGEWLDVIVDPGGGDRLAAVEAAADLYQRALAAERRVIRDATRDELLELYNDAWRGEDPELTAGQFLERLEFTFIRLCPDADVIPIVMSYAAGELFGGHAVDVELDHDLNVTGTNLVG